MEEGEGNFSIWMKQWEGQIFGDAPGPSVPWLVGRGWEKGI
jgi:hypothetical protein